MRLLIAVVIILGCSQLSIAQPYVGVRSGFSYSNFPIKGNLIDGVLTQSSIVGFNAGAQFRYQIGKYFSIQPEVNYFNSRGLKTSRDFGLLGRQSDVLTFHGLEIPLLLKPGFNVYEWNFNLIAGGAFNYYLSGNRKTTLAQTNQNPLITELDLYSKEAKDLSQDFERTDFQAIGGLEVRYEVAQLHSFGADFRYQTGFSDLFNNQGNEIKSQLWQIGISYQYYLGR
jgi:hypothetical protein